MIRLNKVRPYIACQETSHMLQLYDYEEIFFLKIKSQNQCQPTEKEVIYDGGGVGGNDKDDQIFDGQGVIPTPTPGPSQVNYIIYDEGRSNVRPEMEVTLDGATNN